MLGLARSLAAVTVIDCGFCLEQDEELAFDTAAPRCNGATLAFLDAADVVVVVGRPTRWGCSGSSVVWRVERGGARLAPTVVVNRFRSSAVPGDADREIRAALLRYAGVEDVALVPLDVSGVDGAVATGRTLTEAAASSPTRLALADLAAALVGVPRQQRRRHLGRLAGLR